MLDKMLQVKNASPLPKNKKPVCCMDVSAWVEMTSLVAGVWCAAANPSCISLSHRVLFLFGTEHFGLCVCAYDCQVRSPASKDRRLG